MRRCIRFIIVILLLLVGLRSAKAEMYGFERISSNNVENVASQLFVDVISEGSGQVSFKFTNNVGIASSICDIYFDDGIFSSISSITDSGSGVAFSQGAAPGNLPEGNNLNPDFEATFSADSDSPQLEANGIDASGEWVKIYVNLQSEKTLNDVISSLNDGSLRIGLHVQSIGREGGSDGYINDRTVVPVPGAVLLGMLGLSVAGIKLRKLA